MQFLETKVVALMDLHKRLSRPGLNFRNLGWISLKLLDRLIENHVATDNKECCWQYFSFNAYFNFKSRKNSCDDDDFPRRNDTRIIVFNDGRHKMMLPLSERYLCVTLARDPRCRLYSWIPRATVRLIAPLQLYPLINTHRASYSASKWECIYK